MASCNLEEKRNEDATSSRRPSLLLAATSGDKCQRLLLEELRHQGGTGERAAVVAHEVTIDIARDINAPEAMTAGADSVLHVVAAAGDNKNYRDIAKVICDEARHLLISSNCRGDTPLHSATRAGNTEMVQLLIKLAADGEDGGKEREFQRMQNKCGETALHEAVRVGNMVMVEALMEKDPELARAVARDGTSPLYLACALGHKEIAKKMYDHDNKLSYSGPDGQTALHAAVLHGRDMTKFLLECNKGIGLLKQRDIYGSTPLHFAASAPDPSVQFSLFVFISRSLENYHLGSYILPQGCLTKLYEWVDHPLSQLLKFDEASVFQPDVDGSFPVHVAASADSMVSIVILLTKYPGCAGLCDAKGRTFLHVAVEKKRLNIVRFVSLRGRSFKPVLNIQDNNGNTALHLSILDGDQDMFKSLIRNHDVLINLQNRDGKTPMDLAQGKVQYGFYFGLTAQRRILGTLSLANALSANRRRDQMREYDLRLDKEEESKKITEFAQIVGIGSVLVATATFAAAFAMPGGYRPPADTTTSSPSPPAATHHQLAPPPAGTPLLAGGYAFDGFVISNTLAFMCSTLATFSLVYCGVAAVNLQKRITLVSFALALLLCAARSFCAAFAFALYLLLAGVAHGTAIASCVMTALVLLDGLWFLWSSFNDTVVILSRRVKATLLKLVTGFLANIIYLFWPYLVIFGYLFLIDQRINSPAHHQ
ncbi:hypothetical protein BS78_05G282900 [Paspalum vaginatum]|nr:hypothetical protein BS78_05G282900 [Paspalum vaginatum]